MATKGTVNVQTENIFPLIKKFLYSDHEIFLRELVSNAVDATSKLKVMSAAGEVKGEYVVTSINANARIPRPLMPCTLADASLGRPDSAGWFAGACAVALGALAR